MKIRIGYGAGATVDSTLFDLESVPFSWVCDSLYEHTPVISKGHPEYLEVVDSLGFRSGWRHQPALYTN